MERIERVKELLRTGIVIPAVPLALDADKNFDEITQRKLIRYYLEAGAKGIAFAVHTTQFEIREYEAIQKKATNTVLSEIEKYENKNKEIIVKISGIAGNIEDALTEAKLAKKNGFDLLLVSPAQYSKNQDLNGLLNYYKKISEILPVFGFYLQKSVGGFDLPYDFWTKLFEMENVIGVKIACFDRYKTIDVMKAVANSKRYEDIIVYTGNDDHIVFDLISQYEFETKYGKRKVDFKGGLLGQWSVWTKRAVEILNKAKEQKKSGFINVDLIKEGLQLTEANSSIFDVDNDFKGCIAGIHEVLRLEGLFKEINCFDKNGELSEKQDEKIKNIIKEYNHLTDGEFVKKYFDNNN